MSICTAGNSDGARRERAAGHKWTHQPSTRDAYMQLLQMQLKTILSLHCVTN